MEINVNYDYKELRSNAYPGLDQLADALYWKEKGDDSKWMAYVEQCDAVKLQYPKP